MEQRYFNKFREINSGIIADVDQQLDNFFSSESK
jgi:hypothetical protein